MNFVFTSFKIEDCGYYKSSHKDKAIICGTPTDLFVDFFKWAKNCKQITDTKLNCSNDGKGYPVYVSDIEKFNNDYLITLWMDRSFDGSGQVLGLDGSKPPNGTSKVTSRKFKKGYIPGVPAYFFVAGPESTLVTVKPETSQVSGHREFDACIKNFLAQHSCHVQKYVTDIDPKRKTVTVLNPTDDEENSLFPRFSSMLKRNDQKRDFLKTNASKIRKIIHKIDLENKTDQEKKKLLDKLVALFGLGIETSSTKGMKTVRYELDIAVDANEVDEILDNATLSYRKNNTIGFKFFGKNETHWIDQCIDRKVFDLPVQQKDNVCEAKALLSAISEIRSSVIR